MNCFPSMGGVLARFVKHQSHLEIRLRFMLPRAFGDHGVVTTRRSVIVGWLSLS